MPTTPKIDPAREIEFYEAYGRALAEWARVGYVLALIFAELSKIDGSCPGEWCNNGAAVVISGRAGSIKPPPRRAA
jgi:hypothetical protein